METTSPARAREIVQPQNSRHTPLVSVLIACKNRPQAIARLMQSVRRQNYPALEFIVVDDGSEPPIPQTADAHHVRLERSRGACTARNLGLTQARGEYALLLDDDTTIDEVDTITRAVLLAGQDPRLGAVAFLQLMPDGQLHYLQPSYQSSPSRIARFFSYGCLLRTSALHEVGGFEAHFGYYYEEIEMSLRLLDAGYTILCDPSLKVVHYEDGLGRDYRRINRLLLRNSIFTALLRYPAWCVVPGLLVHVYRFSRTTWISRIRDWRGAFWAASQVLKSLRWLHRERKPIRYSTLRLVRRLTRYPAT
jgi:GT2 family glycosyltransferase